MFYRRVEEGGGSHDGPQRWSGGAKQVRGSVKSVIFNCSVKSLIFKSVKYGTFNSVKYGTFNSEAWYLQLCEVLNLQLCEVLNLQLCEVWYL